MADQRAGGSVDRRPLRLYAGEAQLDEIARRQDNRRPIDQEDAVLGAAGDARSGETRQTRTTLVGVASARTRHQRREARLLVVRKGVYRAGNEARDLGSPRESHRGEAASGGMRNARVCGAVLREEPHELCVVGVLGQAREDDAVAQCVAIQLQVGPHNPAASGRGPWKAQRTTAQDATEVILRAGHKHHQRRFDGGGLHRSGALYTKGDLVADQEPGDAAIRRGQQRLAHTEDRGELLASETATDALLARRRFDDGPEELPHTPNRLGLRVALSAELHDEADEVLLRESWHLLFAGHPRGGRCRGQLGVADDLRLRLRDVHIATELDGGLLACNEAEASSGVVRLDHAQKVLRRGGRRLLRRDGHSV
mmetsp:Transcript_18030/g.51245  ORF Transcript_18030/g.51245 Transcript_18030/m.51245 type:complete len:368 (+) Transcript_18030:225-1328(+)